MLQATGAHNSRRRRRVRCRTRSQAPSRSSTTSVAETKGHPGSTRTPCDRRRKVRQRRRPRAGGGVGPSDVLLRKLRRLVLQQYEWLREQLPLPGWPEQGRDSNHPQNSNPRIYIVESMSPKYIIQNILRVADRKHGFRSGSRSRSPVTNRPASGCGPLQPPKSSAWPHSLLPANGDTHRRIESPRTTQGGSDRVLMSDFKADLCRRELTSP